MEPTSAVVFAIGNPLRGDDGVAHRIADLLEGSAPLRRVHQLAPEHAAGWEPRQTVVFVDADAAVQSPVLERIGDEAGPGASPLTHYLTPQVLLALARRLYGFRGEAWLCRAVARDFSLGEALTPEAQSHVGEAARLVQQLLETQCTKHP